ncbi:MAG: hypothetical protein WA151_21845 [Desulfatirhabdiaceae bacterium]
MTQMADSMTMPEAIRVCCDMPGFVADWRRCDHFSNFLAESFSLAKADPFAFSNMLSTIINEVLETIFYHNAGHGFLTLQLSEENTATVLRAEFTVDHSTRLMYEHIVDTLANQDPVVLYEQLLFQVSSLDSRDICLYEIAADYGARLTIETARQPGVICLTVRMGLNNCLKTEIGNN